MSLEPNIAESILRSHLGTPINPVLYGPRAGHDNKKVLGFATTTGLVLALDRQAKGKTRIWFQPPSPPSLAGVRLRSKPAKNADLTRRLAVLNDRKGHQVEIEDRSALESFLVWYLARR